MRGYDPTGLAGTEGKIWITGRRPDTGREFKIGVHAACPYLSSENFAVIWCEGNTEPNLLLSVGGVASDRAGHPLLGKSYT